MKTTRMSIEQYLKIGRCLEGWKERIETTGLAQKDVRTLVSGDVGFEVPLSSIIRVAKELDITWAGSPPKPPPVPIEREAFIILIGAVEGLYVEAGKTVPDNLANLHSAYVKENVVDENVKPPEFDRR